MASLLAPPWLEQLLTTPFFSTCRAHVDAARSECNMFCVDCPSATAFCFYCRSSFHSDHRTIQIRRSSYHDVVRVAEIQKLLDIGGVQTYVINSARVLFLNERPQPRGGGSSTSSGATTAAASSAGRSFVGGGGGAPHICEVCSRTLLDPFRFCSLGCKLERIRRRGDACFVLDGDGEDQEEGSMGRAAAVVVTGEGRRRRRRGRLVVVAEEGKDGMLSSSSSPPPAPAPMVAGSPTPGRRRKGVPQRAPLTS